jgi:hypothetical protein
MSGQFAASFWYEPPTIVSSEPDLGFEPTAEMLVFLWSVKFNPIPEALQPPAVPEFYGWLLELDRGYQEQSANLG